MSYTVNNPSEIKISKIFIKKNNDKIITISKLINDKLLTGASKIKELREYLVSKEDEQFEDSYFIHGGKQITAQENEKIFADFGIKSNATLSVVFRVHGGSAQDEGNEDEDENENDNTNAAAAEDGPRRIIIINKKDIPKGVELSKEECSFTYYKPEIDNEYNIKMSCSHVISSEGMYEYLKSSLMKSNQCIIKCPTSGCNQEWNIDVCLWVAKCNKEEEEKSFMDRLNDNFFKHPSCKIKQCPNIKCGAYVEKPKNVVQNCVRCPLCHAKDWCWWCKREWIGEGVQVCNRDDCSHNAQLVSLLINCDKKEISGIQNIPVIRLCPLCYTTVEYIDGCKHVDCAICKYSFCLSCLKNWKDVGSNKHLQDISNDKCPLQPIQNV